MRVAGSRRDDDGNRVWGLLEGDRLAVDGAGGNDLFRQGAQVDGLVAGFEDVDIDAVAAVGCTAPRPVVPWTAAGVVDGLALFLHPRHDAYAFHKSHGINSMQAETPGIR